MNQINVIRNLIKRFFYAPGSMMLVDWQQATHSQVSRSTFLLLVVKKFDTNFNYPLAPVGLLRALTSSCGTSIMPRSNKNFLI